jgi:hypothetical protein
MFAEWYITTLLPDIRPGTVVSVHDVFHSAEPSEEGAAVLKWLKARGLQYWTPSSKAGREANARIVETRKQLGVDYVVHPLSDINSMLFVDV